MHNINHQKMREAHLQKKTGFANKKPGDFTNNQTVHHQVAGWTSKKSRKVSRT